MELDYGTIITLVLAALGTFAGGFWITGKKKLKQVINLAKEAIDVALAFEKALEDDKITKEEIANLKVQLSEVKASWKILLGK